jgi:DtxR family Mn-dependent transcriptional regulator
MAHGVEEGLSASLEDYLEVIFHLEQANRVARAKDIADQMQVQRASVTGALKSLASRGLVNYSPYSYVTLTSEGREIAEDIIQRHEILKDFFITALQLDPELADANACRIEHAIGPLAIERLVQFVEFIKNCPRTGSDWLEAFAQRCKNEIQSYDCERCLKECLQKATPPEPES